MAAEAVVSFVVERVGDLIIQEGIFLAGVGDQVKSAHTELSFIKDFLKDADAKQRDNHVIRNFVSRTRDVAYDLEDVIETFVLKVESKRKKEGIENVLRRLGCIFIEGVRLHKIGSEIGVINTTISDLKRNLETYGLIRESGGSSTSLQLHERQQQLRRAYSHVVERNVVGLEESAHKLVMRLTKEEHRHHRVVSIWGMGGLGKTTLARQVYHHEEVKRHFECVAWVSISQQYHVRDVLERIYVKLISATKEQRDEIARLKDDEIPGRLSLVQNERKCLIVLDDIWQIETWDRLKAAFECDDESKSKILLTTRKKEVALHPDVNGFDYQPPLLNEIESWELFEKIAMRRKDDAIGKEDYMKMEELGKKMLKACKGLPLAIIVLAGLLARKNTLTEWNTIYENVGSCINRGTSYEEHASVSSVLALSYDDLPYHLKPCFLYLGQFPEDHEIRVNSLTRLWIAEGFISFTRHRQGIGFETMEDVAYNWFGELVERSMVQVGESSSTFNTIKSCRMHDLMRDLCLSKAVEENILKVVNFTHKNDATHPFSSSNISNASPTGKIRRLAIYLDEKADQFVPSRDEAGGGHLRSLLYFGPNDYRWTAKSRELIITSMFKNFKLLRVLKIEGVELQGEEVELPSAIGNMVHLRFLSLRQSVIKSFPRFLGNLICLQTLDFRVENNKMVIPNVIWKMNRLRHLYLPRSYRASGKLQLSSLGDLQTLNSVSSGCCDLNDVSKLRNLRKLRIRLSMSRQPWKNLEKIWEAAGSVLNGIKSLSLWNRLESGGEEDMQQIVAKCGQIYKLRLIGPTVELPKEFHSYSNLTKLVLWECGLKDDQMAKLEKLPNLKSLELWRHAFGENTELLVFSNGSFPRLQFLELKYLNGIREWRVEEGAMPSLCRLVIEGCSGLRRVPDGVRHLTTLKELTISRMPGEFCRRVEQGGEDFHIIQHVPSLVIHRINVCGWASQPLLLN